MSTDDPIEKKSRLASFKEQVGKAVDSAKLTVSNAAHHENTQTLVDWSKKAGAELKDLTVELGNDIQKTEIGRAASKGALVGAVAGVPLPVIGPITGAIVGAAAGAYLNIKYGKKEGHKLATEVLPQSTISNPEGLEPSEVIETLRKLEQLRQEGIITDTELQEQKSKLLNRL